MVNTPSLLADEIREEASTMGPLPAGVAPASHRPQTRGGP